MLQLTRYWCVFGRGWLTSGLECQWDGDPRCWRHEHLPIVYGIRPILSAIGYLWLVAGVVYVLWWVL